jgi:hypothetical protein
VLREDRPEGLDHRFRAQGLRTICIKPGFVKTGMTAGLRPPPFAGEPDEVAKAVVKAIDRGAPVAYVPGIWWLVMWVIRRLPRLVMRRVGFCYSDRPRVRSRCWGRLPASHAARGPASWEARTMSTERSTGADVVALPLLRTDAPTIADADDGRGSGGRIPRKLGRYVVLELVGKGGMGMVCTAYDPKLDRRVALKILRETDVPDARRATVGRVRLVR